MGDKDHYLHGAEDVRSAANTMRSAASEMQSAASSIDSTARQLGFSMETWLQRFEAAVEKLADSTTRPPPSNEHKSICTPDRCHCGPQ